MRRLKIIYTMDKTQHTTQWYHEIMLSLINTLQTRSTLLCVLTWNEEYITTIPVWTNRTYSTEGIQNDASARPPNLTSASCSCDLDLWRPVPKKWSFHLYHLCRFAAKSVHSFSNYLAHTFGNGRTDGRTNERIDERPGRIHYVSGHSRPAEA